MELFSQQVLQPNAKKAEMINSKDFYTTLLDSITEHIVVIDQQGIIHYVNRSWIEFSRRNGYPFPEAWRNINYLAACDASALAGEAFGKEAATGIRKVISGDSNLFYFEYPCHSKTEKRWFTMRITPLNLAENRLYVISHQNITERKLIENEMLNLSRTDGLTGLGTRRYFDEFLESEWRRCGRLRCPLSLILLDIDHFKLFNDTFGHIAGDECLKKIGQIFQSFARRPGDLSARYGGEEFAVILSNTPSKEAADIAKGLLQAVRNRAIPFQSSPVLPVVTVSIGVTTMVPQQAIDAAALIASADTLLYSAKKNGRNRIET